MQVRLSPGESVFVTFDDADGSDDGIRIEYDVNRSNKLVLTASYEDDDGRHGEIYCATFDDDPKMNLGKKITSVADDRDEVLKVIICTSCGGKFDFTKGEERFMRTVFKDNYHDPVRCHRCRKIRMSRRQEAEKKVDNDEDQKVPGDDN